MLLSRTVADRSGEQPSWRRLRDGSREILPRSPGPSDDSLQIA